MVDILKLEDMLPILDGLDVVSAMEQGFIAYSDGLTVVPPVGELIFEEPKGETHIKYGYIKNDDYYVIKVASGFYNNSELGLSNSQGLMLVMNQKTGQPVAVLLDEGHLTDVRTAAAGALAANYFALKQVKAIGIIGTGIQARMQLQYLQQHTPCKHVWIWGRNPDKTEKFKSEIAGNYKVSIASTTSELAQQCNLIVTTTPATTPLLLASDIQSGTHITAMGSDTSEKQELDSALLAKADIVIADSIPQSKSRGEIYRATSDGLIKPEKVVELGTALKNKNLQRTNDNQISIVDLTGVAVQDIMIAEAIYNNYKAKSQ